MLNGTTLGAWQRLGVGGGELSGGVRGEANTFPLPYKYTDNAFYGVIAFSGK